MKEKMKQWVVLQLARIELQFGRLKCWWYAKHKKGKFVRAENNGETKVYACPRCTRETRYKAKAA